MTSRKDAPMDYTRLKLLLEKQETFPLEFVFKFIGRNTAAFQEGVRALQAEYSALELQARRESQGGGHLAMTFLLKANESNEILCVYSRIAEIPDVLVVL